jgi:hypothetical protein
MLHMITDKINELTQLREKVAALATEVATEQSKLLPGLPAQYGFKSTENFIAAVRSAAAGGKGKRGRPSGKSGRMQSTSASTSQGRRRRARITDETRAEVKKLVQSGKTGAQVAKTLKISLPSVQNIKKAFGLVKKRKK